jgi:hypothetical protein
MEECCCWSDALEAAVAVAAAAEGCTHVEVLFVTQGGAGYDIPRDVFRAMLMAAVAACDGEYETSRRVRQHAADTCLTTDADGVLAPRAERAHLLARAAVAGGAALACGWKRTKLHALQFPSVGPYDDAHCAEAVAFRLGGGLRLVFEAQQQCEGRAELVPSAVIHRVAVQGKASQSPLQATARAARVMEQVWACFRRRAAP